ncbi:(2Fe-2S)-binding protein [Desulfobacula phenolica]|uniref:Carbon-monoxide dehydrogenase small subunit n=1 Tax=Desulfobacula phenolica TaxID=90732 RepID=A0A1H2GTI2_9BACT|nr:2Fe-2S iron-sulfur cluster-binding protein [Desulfobacula phenolica]SDU22618.1 carbon-monoxide dehydrogenase small subunit [Desulfobacula phenolica]
MQITCHVNNRKFTRDIAPDLLLIDFVRSLGFKSVKCGCDTANCGLCTVWVDSVSVLSCAVLAARVNGRQVTTLEGLEDQALEFGRFMAAQGVEQCGFCVPGLIMNVLAMKNELENPSRQDILQYLSGNLCRCSGYEGQLRAVEAYLQSQGQRKGEADEIC